MIRATVARTATIGYAAGALAGGCVELLQPLHPFEILSVLRQLDGSSGVGRDAIVVVRTREGRGVNASMEGMSRSYVSLALLLTSALLLGGCATTPTPPSESPSTTVAVSPMPSPEPVVTEPVLAFGGDCDNVITGAQLSSVLGSSAAPRPDGVFDLFWLPSAETGGGLTCAWYANARGEDRIPGADYVWADVLASDQVPAATKQHYSTARCEGVYDGTVCHLGVESTGSWALVSTGLLEYNADVAPQALSDLASFVSANASEHPIPVAPEQTELWWATPDCEVIGDAVMLDEFFSNPAPGYWEGGPGAFDRILSDIGLQIECPWFTESFDEGDTWGTITITLAPGSGWLWDHMARIERESSNSDAPPVTAEDVEVAGATAARQLTYGEGQMMIVATDGSNILRVTSTAGGQVEAAERVLALLNG